MNLKNLDNTYLAYGGGAGSQKWIACWTLIGQFKFPAHQPYTRPTLNVGNPPPSISPIHALPKTAKHFTSGPFSERIFNEITELYTKKFLKDDKYTKY